MRTDRESGAGNSFLLATDRVTRYNPRTERGCLRFFNLPGDDMNRRSSGFLYGFLAGAAIGLIAGFILGDYVRWPAIGAVAGFFLGGIVGRLSS